MDRYVFTSSPLPLQDWSCRRLRIDKIPKDGSAFSTTVLKTRELIFSYSDVIAYPCTQTSSVILLSRPQLFSNNKFISKLVKLSLVDSGDMNLDHSVVSTAVKYTMKARLSPLWNSMGKWLIAGKFFLQAKDPVMGMLMEVNMAANQVELILNPQTFKTTLLKPSELDLSKQAVLDFMNGDEDEALYEEHFGHKKVKVLPNLTTARLVSITKKLPDNNQFKDWGEMKRYWKNMYGYRLCEDDTAPQVYYNVRFRAGSTILSYPEWTVRADDPLPVRRVDPKPCLQSFIQAVTLKNRSICGTELKLSAQVNRVKNVVVPSTEAKGTPCLVSGFPSAPASFKTVSLPRNPTQTQKPWLVELSNTEMVPGTPPPAPSKMRPTFKPRVTAPPAFKASSNKPPQKPAKPCFANAQRPNEPQRPSGGLSVRSAVHDNVQRSSAPSPVHRSGGSVDRSAVSGIVPRPVVGSVVPTSVQRPPLLRTVQYPTVPGAVQSSGLPTNAQRHSLEGIPQHQTARAHGSLQWPPVPQNVQQLRVLTSVHAPQPFTGGGVPVSVERRGVGSVRQSPVVQRGAATVRQSQVVQRGAASVRLSPAVPLGKPHGDAIPSSVMNPAIMAQILEGREELAQSTNQFKAQSLERFGFGDQSISQPTTPKAQPRKRKTPQTTAKLGGSKKTKPATVPKPKSAQSDFEGDPMIDIIF